MISVNALLRESERVSSYLASGVQLAGAKDRDSVLQLFENMQGMFPQWVISTCPMMNPEIRFMTSNGIHLFGYSTEETLRNTSVEKYFSFVHESDHADLYDCIRHIHDFMQELPAEQHSRYRFGLHYRYRRADGEFIYLYDEKAVMNLPESGNLYFALFRDLTGESPFSGVRADIFLIDSGLQKIREFKPGATHLNLSRREQELLTLIRRGLSNKEMAWYLKISQHTVRNIKSKLFGKYNVSSSIELLNMAG